MTEWNKISAGLVTTSAITTTVYDRCGETRCSLSFIFFFFLSGELIDDTCMRTRRQRSQSNVIKSVIESVISVSAREFYYTRGTISLPQSFAARIFLFCLHFSFPRFSKEEHPELRVHPHTLKRDCNVTDQNNVEISKREWWRDSKKIIEITSLIYRFIINLVLFCKYTCFSLFSFFFLQRLYIVCLHFDIASLICDQLLYFPRGRCSVLLS